MSRVFIVALGSNLTNMCGVVPLESCVRAVKAVASALSGDLRGVSGWYRTEAVPASSQPDFINGVMVLESLLSPPEALGRLQEIEARAGRVRGERNAARVLDLDMVAVDEEVIETETLTVPHPRMAQRAFVLHPLCEVAPRWRHPRLGLTAIELRDRVTGQRIERVADAQGLP